MPIFKVNKEEKFVYDNNNNIWEFEFFKGEEEAMKAALSCDWGENSHNNKNCSNLMDCRNLRSCNRLKDSTNLKNCFNLNDCNNLVSCFSLQHCHGLEDCLNLRSCSLLEDCLRLWNCSALQHCFDLEDCFNLRYCSNLRSCNNLSQEDVLFVALGKYNLTIDPEKCRGGCTTKTLQGWLDYEDSKLSEEDNDYLQNITKPAIRFYLASRK